MTDHSAWIRRCYELADEAVARGNHPFGALLVVDGRVVATATNDAVTSSNPTRHAESVLLESALATVPPEVRSRTTLYSSTEPCVMCAGAIYWSGISNLVYGCSAGALASAAGGELLVPCREVLSRGSRSLSVIGPVLEAEGLAKHLAYWPTRARSAPSRDGQPARTLPGYQGQSPWLVGTPPAGGESDAVWMRRCGELARQAAEAGNTPVGAVVVLNGSVVAEAAEAVPAGDRPLAHAELLAVEASWRVLGPGRLGSATLYSTAEPCVLCGFAIREARIGRVVIGRSSGDIGSVGSRFPVLTADWVDRWESPPVVVWWPLEARPS